MCEIINIGTDTDLVLVCEKTRKPIAFSDQYGYFCEDKCDYEEAIKFDKALDKMIDAMLDGEEDET